MNIHSPGFKKITVVAAVISAIGIFAALAMGVVSQLPLYLTNNSQPNVMILLDNSISMDTRMPDDRMRIEVAREVVSNLVKSVSGVRFGLAVFSRDNEGAHVLMNCGDLTAANVDAVVGGIRTDTCTPLGEALSEIWHYFKGGVSPYHERVTYTSPVQSSCQKNFAIVVTDGEPRHDMCYKGDFSSFGCVSQDCNEPPSYDPNNPDAYRSKLHRVAEYMHDDGTLYPAKAFTSYGNRLIVTTYTVGMEYDSEYLRLTAQNGGGEYYTTTSGMDLATAMQGAVNDILGRTSSASAVAVNTAYLTSSTRLYRSRFDSSDWSGYLEAYRINRADGSIAGYPDNPLWEAGALLNANGSRRIYTAGTVSSVYKRIDFTTGNATTLAGSGFMNFSSARASTMIGYIRGDANPAGYRSRVNRKLGDIVYSAPVIHGPPDGYYTDNNYGTFKRNLANRQSLVLVGANDGMLHAFDADSGQEQWAFIPNSLLPKLKLLRKIPYNHANYVNGAITIGDAFITSKNVNGVAETSPAWHSVAVCGLREGGKGYFALDITDPSNPVPLWDITPSSPSTPGLGYSFATPLIVRLKGTSGGSQWVAILANGYESTTAGKAASLIIADLATGAVLKEIVVDDTSFTGGVATNGLATPSAIDRDGDGYVDYIYAGDLKGHLWKFDVTSTNPNNWDVTWRKSGVPVALFRARSSSGVDQPITTAPDVVLRGGYQIVFFGTGKYFEAGDISDTRQQSFYGVYDVNGTATPTATQQNNEALMTRSNLTLQTLTTLTVNGMKWRVSSSNSLSGSSGWYVDLPESGERVIADPLARSRKIIFTTFTPDSSPCSFGGTSWLMELDMDTGGRLLKPAFDVNDDRVVNNLDTVSSAGRQEKPTGYSLGVGMATTPAIVGASDGHEYKYITKTTGEIVRLLEGGGVNRIGLRSWRQIK